MYTRESEQPRNLPSAFAAVGEAHGKMMAQARRLAEADNGGTILVHFAILAGEKIWVARKVFMPPVHLPAQQLFHQGAYAYGKRFSALGIAQTEDRMLRPHLAV